MKSISRRRFLRTAVTSGAYLAVPSINELSRAPAIVTSGRQRPQTPSGIQIGDVLADRAVMNAGGFGPNVLDNTFGPQVAFQKASPTPNTPPTAGFQFFGQVDIDGESGEMRVTLKDVAGASLFVKSLAPAGR